MKYGEAKWQALFQGNYGTPKIQITSGKGCYVVDDKRKRYLDFIGGIATNVLGQAHPAIVKAVRKQIATVGHLSNLYANPTSMALAEKLIELTGVASARVFFCNSGAEANEAALKLSRKTGRKAIVSTSGSFHGRTMGALSLTGQADKRDLFAPIIRKIKYVPYGDIAALKRAINRRTAMFIVEPIQGENGVITPPAGYLKAAREICDANGALLVIDAIQTGMGRTGFWFGYEHEEITPDVITLAKGLGGGLPLGAMIAIGPAATLFKAGEHGSTFGGNPVSCAAGLASINEITKASLNERALELGEFLKEELMKIEGVTEVRGRGLLLGIALEQDWAKEIANLLMAKGVLVNAPNSNTIRIAPALIVTKSECAKFVKIFKEVMANG
ncbi:MAG: acetylornithine transaminase [Candidatus Nanopelagicaceae bacterium]